MKTTTYRIASVLLVLAIAGCSGGGGSSNNAPVANAGADQTSGVQAGDAVLLDGSVSSDPDGDALTYSWSLTTVPADSATTIDDPSSDKPSFVADKAGSYVAQLVVNDGKTDSAPAAVSITVVVPPPKVTISAPENLSVVTATTATVTGTVDDPGATLTVNGKPVANVNGNYTTDVALAEGSNIVTVVGTNGTGVGNASVDVIVNTSNNPALTFTSPRSAFIFNGGGFAMGVPFPISTQFTVQGVIKVNTSVLFGNTPDVKVNGVAASVTPQIFNSACGLLDLLPPFHCWKFTATIPLEQGNDMVTAVGTDVDNRSTTIGLSGIVDYCRIGAYDSQHSTPGYFDPGVRALAGENHDIQNNRCHEIDGCSAPNVTQQCADDPMQCPQGGAGTVIGGVLGVILPAQYNVAPTAFGKGGHPPDAVGDPPDEYFVHGFQSAYDLPCNHHDPCYQTCVPVAGLSEIAKELKWAEAWNQCNVAQRRSMMDVCNAAYPLKCPYTISGTNIPAPVICARYYAEKTTCAVLADAYFLGVSTPLNPFGQSGFGRFKQRQEDYCAQ